MCCHIHTYIIKDLIKCQFIQSSFRYGLKKKIMERGIPVDKSNIK